MNKKELAEQILQKHWEKYNSENQEILLSTNFQNTITAAIIEAMDTKPESMDFAKWCFKVGVMLNPDGKWHYESDMLQHSDMEEGETWNDGSTGLPEYTDEQIYNAFLRTQPKVEAIGVQPGVGNSMEQLGISTWVEPIILENNEIGYAAHFQIDNQTFYVNPRATEEMGKWYEKALITAFQKIKPNNVQNVQVSGNRR